MRALAPLALVALVPAVAIAEPLVCAPPQRGPLDACGKGGATSDDEIARCERDAAAQPHQGQPRFRVAGGAWVAYDAKAWTCLAVPAARLRIAVENHGKKLAVWTLDAAKPCPSGVFDVIGPDFYRAMDARCARRPHPGAITR